MEPIIAAICLTVLFIGSILDFRTREIPDWINYGLIFSGISINLLFSVFFWDYRFIVGSLLGFGVFFIFACVMFYTGQWGGGDSKMIMGLGAYIGLGFAWPLEDMLSLWTDDILSSFPFLFTFIFYMLIAGALYGLIWTIVLAILNHRKWVEKFRERLSDPKVRMVRKAVLGIAIILLAGVLLSSDVVIKITLTTIVVMLVMGFYLYFFIKSIESVSMMKKIPVEKLTEGDWIVNEVKVDGQKICGPKDLGISKEQIEKLIKLKEKGKIEKILVKEGIPFVPSFLAAFVLSYLFGLAPVTMLFAVG